MKKYLLPLILFITTNHTVAGSMLDQFIDPTDGYLDASQFLLDYELGFLPVPIIITEPAVGAGAGMAVAIFHESAEEKKKRKASDSGGLIPPSMTAVAAAGTSNGTKVAGIGHMGHYKNDNLRNESILGYGDVNISLYLDPENPNQAFDMNGQATMLFQQLAFRVGDSRLLLGASYDYLNISNKFLTGTPEIDQLELNSVNAAAGIVLIYDTLNSPFTPSQGFFTNTSLEFYNKKVGGDFNYRELTSRNQYHFPLGEDFVIAGRVDFDFTEASGDSYVPFYAKPSIDMKGIPAARYQGENVITAEVKGIWNFHPRWALSAFTGAGRAADERQDLDKAASQTATGAGFRYMMIRQLGMNSGIDVAKGPETTAVYLSFGSKF